jgi:hypothetical protein
MIISIKAPEPALKSVPPVDKRMADPSIFDSIRIPAETLIALDWRPYRFALQPYHYLVRAAHVLSMALFLGGVGLLDLWLIGWLRTVPLKAFAERVRLWLYLTFGIAAVTGVALFLYDPLHAGSRAYWTPKLIAIAFGLANAALFNKTVYIATATSAGQATPLARVAGTFSLIFWCAALVFACLNTEAMPKVLLR